MILFALQYENADKEQFNDLIFKAKKIDILFIMQKF